MLTMSNAPHPPTPHTLVAALARGPHPWQPRLPRGAVLLGCLWVILGVILYPIFLYIQMSTFSTCV